MQVSILNSKKIAKIDQETCHKARSGFSKSDSDIFELMIVLCTITAQNIGLVSAGPARLPAVTYSLRHHACDQRTTEYVPNYAYMYLHILHYCRLGVQQSKEMKRRQNIPGKDTESGVRLLPYGY